MAGTIPPNPRQGGKPYKTLFKNASLRTKESQVSIYINNNIFVDSIFSKGHSRFGFGAAVKTLAG